MSNYRVKPGFKWGPGKKYGSGDIVELTPKQAQGFLDMLELVVESEPVAEEAELRFPPVIPMYDDIDTALQAHPPETEFPVPPPVEAKPKKGRKPKEVL